MRDANRLVPRGNGSKLERCAFYYSSIVLDFVSRCLLVVSCNR
jgi:hypothetical protein